jgi:hypothetical protein
MKEFPNKQIMQLEHGPTAKLPDGLHADRM